MTALHRPAGTLCDGDDPVLLRPADAGWTYAGLRVLHLSAGVPRTVHTGEFEAFVLPLSGGCAVRVDGREFTLTGRDSVFTRVTDFAYVPRDAEVELIAERDAEIALPMARCDRRLTAEYGPAEGVPVEVRGAGRATRQVNNFGTPGVWEHADKLNACELITPDGNWSSYPPHKHDEASECEVINEEIYYFRIAGRDEITPGPEGFGLHRTYTADGELDENVAVRDGDVFLIPRGYHGPCVAAPGYPMYYLNVLAGPAPQRSMAFCDDPAHSWVRAHWEGETADPRCPVTTHEGRVR
ncbi:5-deoxy-glucuronate isomerase [Nocardia puris]|uniref:5-deoxyglucuronate isomerase n=1 Tax=Nocardia puris TaxID=208602 RepID=A0A366E3F2_9NOCA|nr:5-deoxy-glucuronate isomerase [Nocardia puris]MBF6214457.1 5-deoxy-glucuronate isomerase [Nocardia puris]MBF6369072.1 5-deoxy-glucuronate isomerase [Nocardia puris]MBF6462780.1 5-deoxy-glucuronate isomerase [Nocardia puris]RBO96842.1 5-deoxyglucuronate isomerase [Nocardia puris]